jgi:hypothetical protein
MPLFFFFLLLVSFMSFGSLILVSLVHSRFDTHICSSTWSSKIALNPYHNDFLTIQYFHCFHAYKYSNHPLFSSMQFLYSTYHMLRLWRHNLWGSRKENTGFTHVRVSICISRECVIFQSKRKSWSVLFSHLSILHVVFNFSSFPITCCIFISLVTHS